MAEGGALERKSTEQLEICKDCTVKTHTDHEFEFSKVAAPDTKKKLLDNLSPLRSAVNSLPSAVGDIQNTTQEVVAQEPVEEPDTGVEMECAEALQQLCQTKANITQLAIDLAKCTVRGEGRETAEVGKTAEVTLTTKLTNNKTPRRSVAVVSELKSLRDGSVMKCTVDQSGPGEYNIKYTPTVRGRHKLTVLVDCRQVEGSPFSVSVSISPTLLLN